DVPPGYLEASLDGDVTGFVLVGSRDSSLLSFVPAIVLPTAPSNPVPVLTSISPSTATAGGTVFTLTINGSNFTSSSVANWNGSSRTSRFLSATRLTATISAADITSAGSYSVTVSTPAPGGGVSNALSFIVTAPPNPVPTLTSLNPSTVTAG